MSFGMLRALCRTPVNSLRIGCACRRSYAAGSASASSKDAKKSVPPSSIPLLSPAGSSSPPSSTAAGSAAPRSSCAPDTVLKGVNYLKGQPPLLALPDDAYPEWLWETLKPRVYEDDGPGGKKERMERRRANRQAIKDRNFMQTQ